MNKLLFDLGIDVKLTPKQSAEISAKLDEVDALKAQVEQLRNLKDEYSDGNLNRYDFIKTVVNVIASTPTQCLAERDAEVVIAAMNYAKNKAAELGHFTIDPDDLTEYANQLRQQAEGGG